MDEYKEIFYMLRPDARDLDVGSVTDRRELRDKLQCLPFRWYLDNVFPGLLDGKISFCDALFLEFQRCTFLTEKNWLLSDHSETQKRAVV